MVKEQLSRNKIFVHLLFLILIGVIVMPDKVEVASHIPLAAVIIVIEFVLILLRKNGPAMDIGCLVYCLFIIWELFTSKLIDESNYLIPAPEDVLYIYFRDHELILKGVLISTGFLAIGFVSAVILGLILGVIVGWNKNLREIFMPIVKVVTPIPPLIYSAYLVALLPSFRDASIAIIFLGVFGGMFLSVIYTVSSIDKALIDSVAVLNLKKPSIFVNVLIPYSLPSVLAKLSNSVSTAFMVLISAEMLGGSAGMGWYIKYSTIYGEYDKTISGIILIAVYVTILNFVINKVKRKVIAWDNV